MSGRSQLSKAEWLASVHESARKWKQLSEEDIAAWEKEAEWQQKQRDALLLQPLASKHEFEASGRPQSDMHAFVNDHLDRPHLKKFCHKASYQRLQLNYTNLKFAAEFSNYGMGLQDLEAGLRRDYVNLSMPRTDTNEWMDRFFGFLPQLQSTGLHEEEVVHHQTCWHKFRCCQTVPNAKKAMDLTALCPT